jgi:hypothetical protein
VETQKEFRYPHCVVDEKFHLMTVVSQGRLICKKLTALFFRTTRILNVHLRKRVCKSCPLRQAK